MHVCEGPEIWGPNTAVSFCPSAWLQIPVSYHTHYLVGTHSSEHNWPVMLPVNRCVRVMFLCVCAHPCAPVHVRVDSTSSRVIMHLLWKCCQIMLTPQPPGLGSGRGVCVREEMSGRDWNVCVHYAYEPLPPLSNNSSCQKVSTRGMQPMPTWVS